VTDISIKSPMDQIRSALNDIGKANIVFTISNETPYTGFVEFGTSRMAPRAMVRRSLDSIEKWMSAEIDRFEYPPSMGELENLMERARDHAIREIQIRTPVKTGLLKSSWKAEGPEWRV
jgi:hypothetical protein